MANKHLLFVYGSLKQGMLRNAALRGQRYIGVAFTEPQYAMYQLSGYPAQVNKNHPEAETLLNEAVKEPNLPDYGKEHIERHLAEVKSMRQMKSG